MKALSVRQPWAWAILHAGKRIENRERADGRMPSLCSYRGPLLIHAAKDCSVVECEHAIGSILKIDTCRETVLRAWPGRVNVDKGGIVGVCNVVSVVEPEGRMLSASGLVWERRHHLQVDMRWHAPGSYGLVLTDVRPLPFVPFKGALSFFDVPDALVPEAFT